MLMIILYSFQEI